MANRSKKKYSELPENTIIEVVAIKGDKVIKKQMTILAASLLKKSKGWVYTNYQINFCSIKKNN